MPQSPNADLCGQPGSRRRLNTPALLLDLDAFDHNLAAMAALAERAGLGLRPHAKAHKSVAVARRQLAAGALGISCATLGEAEVMAGAGLPGLLVEMLVDADVKVAQGALQTVTGDLAALLGRPTTTLREAVTAALRH